MSDMKQTNPQTLLAAAEMTPRECKIVGSIFGRICRYRVFEDGIACEHCMTTFNPHDDPADAWALEGALMEHGWIFRKSSAHGLWIAKREDRYRENSDRPTLLLKCVDVLRCGG